MNRIYIIGSGASVDFYPQGYGTESDQIIQRPVPLASNFLNAAIEYGKLKKEYYPDLWDFILRKHKVSFEDIEGGASLNIETVYCDLEREEMLYEHEKSITEARRSVYQAKTDLLDMIEELLMMLSRYYGRCTNHQKFADKIVSERSHVISFNWDPLMDDALHNTERWFYHDGYGIDFFRMYEDRRELKENGRSESYLLKPHGSINWFRYRLSHWSDNNGFTCGDVTQEESERTGFYTFSRKLTKNNIGWHEHPVNQRLHLGKDYSPLLKVPCEVKIVPPGLKRKELPEIWRKIKEILRDAEEVVAIGFSFNKKDSYVRQEFEGAEFKKGLRIYLVNPATGTGLENLKAIYRGVFHTDCVEKICGSFKEYCEC